MINLKVQRMTWIRVVVEEPAVLERFRAWRKRHGVAPIPCTEQELDDRCYVGAYETAEGAAVEEWFRAEAKRLVQPELALEGAAR